MDFYVDVNFTWSLFTTLVASVLESMCLGIKFAHAELEWIRDFD